MGVNTNLGAYQNMVNISKKNTTPVPRKLWYESHDTKALLPPQPLVAAAAAAAGVDADVVREPSPKQTDANTAKLSGLQASN